MRILVIDDDEVTRKLLREVLEKEGYTVQLAASGEAALTVLRREFFSIILSDIRMLDVDGMAVLRQVKKCSGERSVVILMTGFGSLEGALGAIREGAFDYVSKPFRMEALRAVIQRAVKHLESLEVPGKNFKKTKESALSSKALVGKSQKMVEVFKVLARAAMSSSPVLIMGEQGTGKGLVARSIHDNGVRRESAFIGLDCRTQAEIEMASLLAKAKSGSLFLDEISLLSLPLQKILFEAMEEGDAPRLIAATRFDLEKTLRAGRFRDDLYYKLKVITIELPPLRERIEDVQELVEHFVAKFSEQSKKAVSHVSDDAASLLRAYSWPGNVRELENAIERAIAFASSPILFGEDFPAEIRPGGGVGGAASALETPSLEVLEKSHILKVLQETHYNKSRASEVLGIDRATLYRKAERYGIELRGK